MDSTPPPGRLLDTSGKLFQSPSASIRSLGQLLEVGDSLVWHEGSSESAAASPPAPPVIGDIRRRRDLVVDIAASAG